MTMCQFSWKRRRRSRSKARERSHEEATQALHSGEKGTIPRRHLLEKEPISKLKEKYPEARPRIISDNGPQFIAKDFKEFIRISGMTHVRTSPFYPQSNGKIERWHKSLKGECIRPGTPLSLDDARRLVEGYVEHYNNVRLNSATGYITPKDMLAGGSRRSTRSATGSWRRRGNNGRFVASRPPDVQIAPCWAWFCW